MRNPVFAILGSFLALLCGTACDREAAAVPERGHDPWVFRSVLDNQPRMLTAALHSDLWVAYSAETGSLYKAWRGGVELDGAVYTTAHGPQPLTQGAGWTENEFVNPWRIERGGQRQEPRIQYRGHRFLDGQVYINSELYLAGGQVVRVSERPEYVTNESGQTGLERTFFVEGVPQDAELFFLTKVQSLPFAGSLQTDGQWTTNKQENVEIRGVRSLNLEGELQLRRSEPTRLTTFFTGRPLLPNPHEAVAAAAVQAEPPGARLIERSGCKTCHNQIVKTVGPAYVDIADRYPNTSENIGILTAKVRDGGSGNWGEAAMTPHTHLPEEDIRTMVTYIMELDAEEETSMASPTAGLNENVDEKNALTPGATAATGLQPGAVIQVFLSPKKPEKLDDIDWQGQAAYSGVVPVVDFRGAEFGDLTDNFGLQITGYLHIERTSNYLFRLTSDDGSRLYLDDQLILDHDGLHGPDPKDAEIALKEGYHKIRVIYFESGGGQELTLHWRSFFSPEWTIVPSTALFHPRENTPPDSGPSPLETSSKVAGDRSPVAGVHPSYTLSQARPDGFAPKVGGMDFFSDGRLAISTWDAEGAVYVLDGVTSGDPSKISYTKVATGLAEPLGLKVVNDTIYVMQKQELTQLIDHDGDDIIDEYRTVSNAWRVSPNFHEFGFGLAYKEPYFYASLAIAILPGGASARPQIPDRGKAIQIHKETGELEILAHGLRTPNGVGFGADGELFIADNQGDWLPSSKILHVTPGDFFNSYAVDSINMVGKPVKPPVVWLPQDEIGNSPSTPSYLNDGPYKGQMIHGEVTHGGIKRVFVEKVDGEYQGAVFRFTQGLEAGINRLVWGPDSALYVGGIGSTGNWQHSGKLWYGLQRLKYNGQPTFEMLAVRAKSDGVEIEFTEPLAAEVGTDPAEYTVQQWRYEPTPDYGGPKLDPEALAVRSVNISADRRRIFLELNGLKPEHVVYLRLPNTWTSQGGRGLWSTESWYTLNRIPRDQPGFRRPTTEMTAH